MNRIQSHEQHTVVGLGVRIEGCEFSQQKIFSTCLREGHEYSCIKFQDSLLQSPLYWQPLDLAEDKSKSIGGFSL